MLKIEPIRLAQLRKGYFPVLNSHLSRICNNVDNRSPKCDLAPLNVNRIFNCSKNTTGLKVIDLGEKPVEVANCLDLIPSDHTVKLDHTAQNNPPILPLSTDVGDASPAPPTRGLHVIHRGVGAERSPHHKQVVDRQSHYYYYIYFSHDTNATKVPVKNSNKRRYHAKIACQLQLCATATTTTRVKRSTRFKNLLFRAA